MKNCFKHYISLLLIFCFAAALTACNNGSKISSSSKKKNTSAVSSGAESIESESESETPESEISSAGVSSKADVSSKASQSSKAKTSSASTSSTAPATSLTRDQVIAKMPSKLKGTTLKYMYWWDPNDQMEGEAIAKFQKATGITLKPVVSSYSDFQTQLTTKIQADDAPDLIRLLGNVSWQITALQPITNSGFNFNDKAWDQALMKDYTFNGKYYAANLKDSAISDVAVLYYNKKALDDAEMEDPYSIWKKNPKNWTWEKFWSMCGEFVAANKTKSGYYGATFEYSDAYVRSMGGSSYHYDSSKGAFVNNMKSSFTEAGWKTTLEAVEKGWLVKAHDETKFDQGKALFFWSGPFSARAKDNRQKALKDRNRLGVVPLPTDSKYQVMYEYTAFGIPLGAKNAEAAPYYLRYVLDKSSYDMNGVYCNSQAREVVEYACSLTNRFYGVSSGTQEVTSALAGAGSNQVKSVLNSYFDSVQTFIEAENERITYLGQ